MPAVAEAWLDSFFFFKAFIDENWIIECSRQLYLWLVGQQIINLNTNKKRPLPRNYIKELKKTEGMDTQLLWQQKLKKKFWRQLMQNSVH